MPSYRELRVWQEAMSLAEECYLITRAFPRSEAFGLTNQIRRAAGSVPANIAEGYGRGTDRDYANSLRIARGSLRELETHLLLESRVGCATEAATAPSLDRCDDVGRMLHGLIARLESRRRE
jgi:four helix bundle protein